jgi:hypothetical protein
MPLSPVGGSHSVFTQSSTFRLLSPSVPLSILFLLFLLCILARTACPKPVFSHISVSVYSFSFFHSPCSLHTLAPTVLLFPSLFLPRSLSRPIFVCSTVLLWFLSSPCPDSSAFLRGLLDLSFLTSYSPSTLSILSAHPIRSPLPSSPSLHYSPIFPSFPLVLPHHAHLSPRTPGSPSASRAPYTSRTCPRARSRRSSSPTPSPPSTSAGPSTSSARASRALRTSCSTSRRTRPACAAARARPRTARRAPRPRSSRSAARSRAASAWASAGAWRAGACAAEH